MLHGMAARGTLMVVGVTPPYNGASPQSTDTTAPAGFDRTGIFSVVSLTTVAQRAAAKTTAAASRARFMAGYHLTRRRGVAERGGFFSAPPRPGANPPHPVSRRCPDSHHCPFFMAAVPK